MKIVYSENLKDFIDNAIDNYLSEETKEIESYSYIQSEFPELPIEYIRFKYSERLTERRILGTLPKGVK